MNKIYIAKDYSLFDSNTEVELIEWSYVDPLGFNYGIFKGLIDSQLVQIEDCYTNFRIINLNEYKMKNKELFNTLQKNQFDAIGTSLCREFKPNYNMVINFNEEDDNIQIMNSYYNSNDKFDYVKKYPVYSGKCTTIKEFNNIIQLINVEEEVKLVTYA